MQDRRVNETLILSLAELHTNYDKLQIRILALCLVIVNTCKL